MPSIAESLNSQDQLADTLAAGLNTLSLNQTVEFTQYVRQVISEDGTAFYVNTGMTVTVQGSLHYAIDRQQNEDETIDVNRVIFTALSQIDIFDQAAPTDLFIGTFNGERFAWRARHSFYQQANLYHYEGNAVYPALSSQIIDSAADLPIGPIVTNSLPIWLTLTAVGTQPIPVYPSYLVPANIVPPYIVAHVEPDMTEVPSFPIYEWPGTPTPPAALQPMASTQLAKDRVRLTLYGFNNQQAIQYLVSLIEYSLETENFGFGNSPAIKDAKRTQSELSVIAMKKTIDIDAWYLQGTSDAIARRLILSAGFSSITT
ncbi:TPA: hypothetical protein ACKE3D_002119 [Burkholderia dolosa]